MISDAPEGLKAAVAKVLNATWQRCRIHFMRNALAHAGKHGRRVVSAFIGTTFAQDDAEAARAQWRQVADQLRPRVKKLAQFMDDAENDVLAYMNFPAAHRSKLHSTNPSERVNGEIKSCTEVVGSFPNDEAIIRVAGAILLEQNNEWAVQRAALHDPGNHGAIERRSHRHPARSGRVTQPAKPAGERERPRAHTPCQWTRSAPPLSNSVGLGGLAIWQRLD